MARANSLGVRNGKRGKAQAAASQASRKPRWTLIDLFSGAGGTAAGFHRHGRFRILGAVDLEVGKPSEGNGTLQCNSTYKANLGVQPISADLTTLSPKILRRRLEKVHGRKWDGKVDLVISCAPCTGFSRVKATNHASDDPKNALVVRSALFVKEFKPRVFIMENTRELITGEFKHYHEKLLNKLRKLGYNVRAGVHLFSRYGLPQNRERALIIAVRNGLPLRTLDELWKGYRVRIAATTVRAAIGGLPPLKAGSRNRKDRFHTAPEFVLARSYKRLKAIPRDGGDWRDLLTRPETRKLLIPAMKRHIKKGQLGSHSDAYGRLWWDRPSVTIKRECSHVGNGRYSHPSQTRLLSVREMATLQGFPRDYVFAASGISRMYRHIGDAVPPLISYQLAHLVSWILARRRPGAKRLILPGSHLRKKDVVALRPKRKGKHKRSRRAA